MPRKLLNAILRSSSGQFTIDAESGIIRGVKLMELGKLAKFAGEDGKQKQVTITADHISALLSHAGNRAIPIHRTHEWFSAQGKDNADSVEMEARIGALKSFRRDNNGHLIADAHLNKARTAALDFLWGASENPEDNCFSVVFSYLKDDPKCIPQNFRAGDIVPAGAATTALFSENQNTPMEPKEFAELLIAALADKDSGPKLKTALLSVSTVETDDKATAEAIEKSAGVTDADRKPEDTTMPALMSASVRVQRAGLRQQKESQVAFLAEVETKASAAATALLGKGKFLNSGSGDNKDADEYDALVTAKLSATPGMGLGRAKYLVNLERPELFAKKQEQLALQNS